jgi:hypothetical protein
MKKYFFTLILSLIYGQALANNENTYYLTIISQDKSGIEKSKIEYPSYLSCAESMSKFEGATKEKSRNQVIEKTVEYECVSKKDFTKRAMGNTWSDIQDKNR